MRIPDDPTRVAERMQEALSVAHAAIRARRDWWTRLLQEMIRIPSCFGGEHDIAARVCEHVTAAGLRPILVPMSAAALRSDPDAVPPISDVTDRNNIVVRITGTGGGRSLVVNCHLDTQPAGDATEWTHPPFSGHVDPDTNTVFGRGAMDDKAGVAICLALLQLIQEHGVV